MAAWGQILASVASILVNTDTTKLRCLEIDSEILHSQLSHYLSISDQFATVFAFEMLPTRLPTGNAKVVVTLKSDISYFLVIVNFLDIY